MISLFLDLKTLAHVASIEFKDLGIIWRLNCMLKPLENAIVSDQH